MKRRMKTMGERLRKARQDARFTSARSAAISHGWTPSTYAAHENGQNDYGAEQAEIYAKAFKVSAEWLLLGKQEAAPGIDKQLMQLPPDEARALIDRFNSIIEGARIIGKTK